MPAIRHNMINTVEHAFVDMAAFDVLLARTVKSPIGWDMVTEHLKGIIMDIFTPVA